MANNTLAKYGEDFQLMTIRLFIDDPTIFKSVKQFLDPQYYSIEPLAIIYTYMLQYTDKYQHVPTFDMLKTFINVSLGNDKQFNSEDSNTIKSVVNHKLMQIFQKQLGKTKIYVEQEIVQFCKQMATLNAIEKSIAYAKQEDYDSIISEFKNAIKVGVVNLGLDYNNTVEERYDPNNITCKRKGVVPTGFKLLDKLIDNGLGRGELGVVGAFTGIGKALSVNTKILTPNGYMRIGDVHIGDLVIGKNGKPTKVEGVFPQGERDAYRITFSDGYSIICDEEHLWKVQPKKHKHDNAPWRVMNTKDIASNLLYSDGQLKWFIPMVDPIQFNEQETKIDPYLLGVLIGDGGGDGGIVIKQTQYISSAEHYIFDQVREKSSIGVTGKSPIGVEICFINQYDWKLKRSHGNNKNNLESVLQELGLIGTKSATKFIPKQYLFNSINNRVQLLRGLMDADGTVEINSRETFNYCTISKQLAEDFCFLIQSLGGSITIRPKKTNRQTVYRMSVSLSDSIVPFSLPRKLSRWSPRKEYGPTRAIKSIERCGREEMICIKVDASDSLYVAEHCIVTHNTSCLITMGTNALRLGKKVVHYTFENDSEIVARKYDCAMTNIAWTDMLGQSKKIIEQVNKLTSNGGHLFVQKYPQYRTTLSAIESHIENLRDMNFEPDLVIIDYLDIMLARQTFKEKRDTQTGLYEDARGMGSELGIPIWTATQFNRKSFDEDVADTNTISESIGKAMTSDLIVTINRKRIDKINGTGRLYISKSRLGPDSITIPLTIDLARMIMREDPNAMEAVESTVGLDLQHIIGTSTNGAIMNGKKLSHNKDDLDRFDIDDVENEIN